MAPPKEAPANGGAPGGRVVEALASPLYARFVEAALEEARTALRAQYTAPAGEGQESRALTPTQAMTLDSLTCLGAQLVTATTPTGGGS